MIRVAACSSFPCLALLASVAAAVELKVERGQSMLYLPTAEGSAYQVEQSEDMRAWHAAGSAVRGDGSLLRMNQDLPDHGGQSVFFRVGRRPVWSPADVDGELIKKITEYEGPDDRFEAVDDGYAKTVYVTFFETQDGELYDATVEAVASWETGGMDLNEATFTLVLTEVVLRSPIEGRFTISELVELSDESPPERLVANLRYAGPESGTYEISYYEYGGLRFHYSQGRIEDLLSGGGSGSFF